jgi:hypothetical protein
MPYRIGHVVEGVSRNVSHDAVVRANAVHSPRTRSQSVEVDFCKSAEFPRNAGSSPLTLSASPPSRSKVNLRQRRPHSAGIQRKGSVVARRSDFRAYLAQRAIGALNR